MKKIENTTKMKLKPLTAALLILVFRTSHSLHSPYVSVNVSTQKQINSTGNGSSEANGVVSFQRVGSTVDIFCDFKVNEAALSEAADGLPLEDIVQV